MQPIKPPFTDETARAKVNAVVTDHVDALACKNVEIINN